MMRLSDTSEIARIGIDLSTGTVGDLVASMKQRGVSMLHLEFDKAAARVSERQVDIAIA